MRDMTPAARAQHRLCAASAPPLLRLCSASPVAGRVLNDSIQHAELIKASRVASRARASQCCALTPCVCRAKARRSCGWWASLAKSCASALLTSRPSCFAPKAAAKSLMSHRFSTASSACCLLRACRRPLARGTTAAKAGARALQCLQMLRHPSNSRFPPHAATPVPAQQQQRYRQRQLWDNHRIMSLTSGSSNSFWIPSAPQKRWQRFR